MAYGHYHRSLFIGLQAQQLMQAGGIEVMHGYELIDKLFEEK